jgi:hypothetical protein
VNNADIGFPMTTEPSITPFVGFSLAWLTISYSLVFVFDAEQIRRLSAEDGVVEYIGAALFFLASVLYFLLYKNSRLTSEIEWLPVKGNVFYFLLAVGFLFVCLEEISWGQRIFGFETPDSIREMNSQSEFNFHNLDIFHGETSTGERKSFLALLLNMERLFSIFWFSYCFLVPLVYQFSYSGRAFLQQLIMPIVPMSLGLVYVANYAVSRVLELIVSTRVRHPVIEIKESIIAMLFVVLAI